MAFKKLSSNGVSVRDWMRLVGLLMVLMLAACASPPKPYDFTAFKQSRPASMLVLPPVNQSADVNATAAVLATATAPLAEAGYYVMPVSLVYETFHQNGLTVAEDMHAVPVAKLRQIFGADAAVYLTVTEYGTKYQVVGSDTRVAVVGKIVDLRSGVVIWEGKAVASSQEAQGGSQGGVIGMLVKALVDQVVNTTSDASFNYAGVANQRLLGGRLPNGILAGPRSPKYREN